MGMQVTSLSMGSSLAVTALKELSQEKRQPLPGESKAAEPESHSLPGPADANRKGQFINLRQTTSELERISLAFDRRLKFVIDQESREILIKVIDNETDKVIKVLPPEELQRLHSRIRETFGFLIDRMV